MFFPDTEDTVEKTGFLQSYFNSIWFIVPVYGYSELTDSQDPKQVNEWQQSALLTLVVFSRAIKG